MRVFSCVWQDGRNGGSGLDYYQPERNSKGNAARKKKNKRVYCAVHHPQPTLALRLTMLRRKSSLAGCPREWVLSTSACWESDKSFR